MKYVIITQVKNQENRIYDWIKYHSSQGFDTFIIFDDFSEDSTVSEIYRADNELNIKLILNNTDNIGGKYDIESCKNSETYGFDKSFHDRLNRSYTYGNNMVKEINPDAICAVIDVDEFIVTDSEKNVTEIIQECFDKNNCKQILVFNFDIKHDYNLEKDFLFKNKFKRWCYDDVDKSPIWRNRCKSIIISKYVDVINFVHLLINPSGEETFQYRNYSMLRMLHFRIPNLNGNGIKFVDDNRINELFNKK